MLDMVDFRKILHQTSVFGPRKRGHYKKALYRITKAVTTPMNALLGTSAIYVETETEISGDLHPFSSVRWGEGVSEKFADWVLVTNTEFNYDNSDDRMNDEIEYDDVRYRIVGVRHHNRLAFDDMWQYALRRLRMSAGGIA